MNKKLIVIVFLLWSSAYCAFGQANQWGPFDPGALRNDGSNASSAATVRDNLGLGTMAVATSTDYVATSALALRLDTTNASISNNLDVAGNVGAATINGVAPLTAAEKTQALVGSSTVDFDAQTIEVTPDPALGDSQGIYVKSATSTSSIAIRLENDIGSFTRIMKTRSAAAAPSANGTVIYHDNDPMVQIKGNGQIKLFVISTYADNAAALSGGLVAGDIYRTSTGVLMIVY